MIHYLKIENFYSIQDPVTLSFEVTPSVGKQNSESYLDSSKERVSKTTIIIGSNASGKTNIFRALLFLQNIITKSSYSRYQHDDYLPFVSFQNNQNKASCIEVKFTSNKKTFIYKCIFNQEKILNELLTEISKGTKLVFKRETKDESADTSFGGTFWQTRLPSKQFLSKLHLRPQISLIAAANSIDQNNVLKDVFDYWDNNSTTIVDTLIGRSRLIARPSMRLRFRIERSLSFLRHQMARSEIIESKVKKIIQQVDPSFEGVKLHETELGERHTIRHQSATSSYFELEPEYEASGTQKMIIFLAEISNFLLNDETSGFIAIDELDAYFHPAIVKLFVDLFLDADYNLSKTQLIFSSHYHHIINSFDKQQIILVDRQRNQKGQPTNVYRLDDIEGVRTDDNFYAKYMAGTYGATPEIQV